ncbi:hypothetical protein LV779_24910 [Streptomyces thinghirensis]|nr:hypothetical protein [Streptomyces thinghirensis]
MLCDASLWSDVGFPDGHPVHHVALTEPSVGELADSVLVRDDWPVRAGRAQPRGHRRVRGSAPGPERVAGLCLVSTNAGAPRPRAVRGLARAGRAGRRGPVRRRGRADPCRACSPGTRRRTASRSVTAAWPARSAPVPHAPSSPRRPPAGTPTPPCAPPAAPRPWCAAHATPCAPPGYHRAIADAVPGARLHAVPDAGHLLPWERPDALTSVLDGLVTAVQAGRRLARAGRPSAPPPSTPPLPSLRTKEPPCHTT